MLAVTPYPMLSEGAAGRIGKGCCVTSWLTRNRVEEAIRREHGESRKDAVCGPVNRGIDRCETFEESGLRELEVNVDGRRMTMVEG